MVRERVNKGVAWIKDIAKGAGLATQTESLAFIGIDIFTDVGLRKQAKGDFDKRTDGYSYKSPIPDIIKEPSGLPDDMRSYGTRDQLKVTILKGEGDDSFDPYSQGHSHNY